MSDTKTCALCGEEKPVGEFWKRKESADGLTSKCGACLQEARRESDARRVDNYTPTSWCQQCYGMSWVRPRDRECACGEEYKPEQMPRAADVVTVRSPVADMWRTGESDCPDVFQSGGVLFGASRR